MPSLNLNSNYNIKNIGYVVSQVISKVEDSVCISLSWTVIFHNSRTEICEGGDGQRAALCWNRGKGAEVILSSSFFPPSVPFPFPPPSVFLSKNSCLYSFQDLIAVFLSLWKSSGDGTINTFINIENDCGHSDFMFLIRCIYFKNNQHVHLFFGGTLPLALLRWSCPRKQV